MMQKIKNKIYFVVILIISFNINNVTAQSNRKMGTDTLYLIGDKYKLIIDLPFLSFKSISPYEEGFFVSYSNNDTSVLTIHYGSMVSKPLIKENECTVLNNFILENKFQELSGFCIVTNNIFSKAKKYFKEMDFTNPNITVMYEWVNESEIDKYNKILENIKIIKNP